MMRGQRKGRQCAAESGARSAHQPRNATNGSAQSHDENWSMELVAKAWYYF